MTMTPVQNWLKQTNIFANASDKLIDALSTQAMRIAHHKNHIIFLQDDPADRFYLITQGWVKLYRETRDGNQAVIDIVGAGHLFAHTSLLENKTHLYTAEATEKVEIISFPLSILAHELNSNPDITLSMLKTVNAYNKKQNKELEHRTLQNAPQRIGCFLLGLINDTTITKNVIVNLPYEKTLIAARLGMQPETFSRALSKLKSATNIDIEKSHVTVPDVEKLSSFSCVSCSSEFPCKEQ